jgi:hypothetical protein
VPVDVNTIEEEGHVTAKETDWTLSYLPWQGIVVSSTEQMTLINDIDEDV